MNECALIMCRMPPNRTVSTRPLGGWRRYKPELGALMKAQLARIAATEGLSKNVYELATKALAD